MPIVGECRPTVVRRQRLAILPKPPSQARVALGIVVVEGPPGPLGCHPVLLRLSTPSRLAGASPSALRANSSKQRST